MNPPDPNKDQISQINANDEATGSRLRTESECSINSDDGQKGKRFCASPQLVVGGLTGASPPKFVSLEEIMQAANSMKDMALVHQIVVDDNFKLSPPTGVDTVRARVRETMRQAFWDMLRAQLAQDPPEYSQALVLLEDIKKGLFSVLLPQHTKIKQQIGEVLDSELIAQQANNGTIDFPHYAQYVISVMAKLCAPVRDDKIKELSQATDVVETFKGILETLDLMILDMANFTLEVSKKDIIAHSVDWERKKFADYLNVVPDGLENTRKWLLRHLDTSSDTPTLDRVSRVRNLTSLSLANAYVELLEWQNENGQFPETLIIDEARLMQLQEQLDKLVLVAAIILVTLSSSGPHIQGFAPFKEQLKDHLCVLINNTNAPKNLSDIFPNLTEQVIQDIKDTLIKLNANPLTEDTEKLLRNQIMDIAKPDHRIRQLIRVRVREFLLQIITCTNAAPARVPVGLSAQQKELAQIAGHFLRIVSHNRAVFSHYYLEIVDNALINT